MKIFVHIDGVDGQTSVTFGTNSVADALKFLTREDHEGASVGMVIDDFTSEEVYQILQQLSVHGQDGHAEGCKPSKQGSTP